VTDASANANLDRVSRCRRQVALSGTRVVRRLKGQPVQLVIKKQARPKSRSQMGYWWAVVIPILADHFGYMEYEYDAVHDQVMRELRGIKPDPNPLKLRVSMGEMTHEEVSALIEEARFWALDKFGVVIPDADKVEAS
jgi:hypothetical protein